MTLLVALAVFVIVVGWWRRLCYIWISMCVYLPVLTCSTVIVWKASNKSHVYTIINCTSNIMYVFVCVCYGFNAFTICMVSAHCSETMLTNTNTLEWLRIITLKLPRFSEVRKTTIKIEKEMFRKYCWQYFTWIFNRVF